MWGLSKPAAGRPASSVPREARFAPGQSHAREHQVQQAGIGAISDAVRQSAADWEEQRKAQSGESYKTFEEKVTEARGY